MPITDTQLGYYRAIGILFNQFCKIVCGQKRTLNVLSFTIELHSTCYYDYYYCDQCDMFINALFLSLSLFIYIYVYIYCTFVLTYQNCPKLSPCGSM